jgi:hypothetical protein
MKKLFAFVVAFALIGTFGAEAYADGCFPQAMRRVRSSPAERDSPLLLKFGLRGPERKRSPEQRGPASSGKEKKSNNPRSGSTPPSEARIAKRLRVPRHGCRVDPSGGVEPERGRRGSKCCC